MNLRPLKLPQVQTLVFATGALGDHCLLWPMLRAMEGEVAFVGRASYVQLAAEQMAHVHPVDADLPDLSRLFVGAAREEVSGPVAKMLDSAQRVISFVSDGHDAWAQNIWYLAGQSHHYFAQMKSPADEDPTHALDDLYQQLEKQGCPLKLALAEPRLNPEGPVVIHPGSGGERKCWYRDRFVALIEHFQKIGREVMVVGGEAERELWPDHELQTWHERYGFELLEDVRSLMHRIQRASLFIGNDSGPAHLAGALGVKTLALFGPTDPRIWHPLGPQVKILSPASRSAMSWLEVDQVIEAASF